MRATAAGSPGIERWQAHKAGRLLGYAARPDTNWLTVAKAISRRLRALRKAGSTPAAIVLDPALWALFRESRGGAWDLHRPSLFDLPVEVDRSAYGWTVRVCSMTSVA